MSIRSSLYVGSVMHRRLHPRRHRFRYRAYWLLLDLDEIDELSSSLRWFSRNRINAFSFFDADHGDGTATPIRSQVERRLAEANINVADGRIRLLCMPRSLGFCFNPISIYFCFRADASLAAVIYQVHNTFGERHSYVIPVVKQNGTLSQRGNKVFYVSPFLDMDMRYDFRITGPDERITVAICASSCQKPVLNAVLTGVRKELSNHSLMSAFFGIPGIAFKVIVAIHWEALQLWVKGIGLRQRPQPPEQSATIVTTSSETAN